MSNLFFLCATVSVLIGALTASNEFYSEGYAIGYYLGIFIAHLLRKDGSPASILTSLLRTEWIYYYFGRPLPGEVEEILILQGASQVFKVGLPFLVTMSLSGNSFAGLRMWCFSHIIGVFTLRSFGLVMGSHFLGLSWFPARDNFLIDLPAAVLASLGFSWLIRQLHFRLRMSVHSSFLRRVRLFLQLLPLIFTVLIVMSYKRSWYPKSKPPELLSWALLREVTSWNEVFFSDEKRELPRVLSYFHGFGRRFGIADVREYQSLLTDRYARYSIRSRLGLQSGAEVSNGRMTGRVSDRFKRLAKIELNVSPVHKGSTLEFDYYYYYLVHAVPPLDCDHLRFLGVSYIEGTKSGYYQSNFAAINKLYSLQSFGSDALASDVQSKINLCRFKTKILGAREFWVVPEPLPRAFFVEKMRVEELSSKSLETLRVFENHSLSIHGKRYSWKEVKPLEYQPNNSTFKFHARVPGVLIVTDLFNQYWEAHVNGMYQRVVPVFGFLRGVPLDKGASHVLFKLPYPRRNSVMFVTVLGVLLIGLAMMMVKAIQADHEKN